MRSVLIFSLCALFLFLPFAQVHAQEARSSEHISVSKNETIDNDFFASGKTVNISGTINGDTYLLAENVLIDGAINGDLIVLGQNIRVTGTISGNVRAVGQNILIYGEIGKNITGVAQNLKLLSPSIIMGSLVGLGETVALNVPLGKGATIGANDFTLNSNINGDLLAGIGENLILAPGASVAGDITYYTGIGKKLSKADTASVSGEITHNIYISDKQAQVEPSLFSGAIFFLHLLWLFSAFLIGLLLVIALPVFMTNTANILKEEFLKSFITGAIFFVATPLVILLLLISFVGIPIAFLMIQLFLLLIFIAGIFSAAFLGNAIFLFLKKKSSPVLKFIVGFIVYGTLTFIPIFGPVLIILGTFLGIGALMIEKRRIFLNLRSKKLL